MLPLTGSTTTTTTTKQALISFAPLQLTLRLYADVHNKQYLFENPQYCSTPNRAVIRHAVVLKSIQEEGDQLSKIFKTDCWQDIRVNPKPSIGY